MSHRKRHPETTEPVEPSEDDVVAHSFVRVREQKVRVYHTDADYRATVRGKVFAEPSMGGLAAAVEEHLNGLEKERSR